MAYVKHRRVDIDCWLSV